jgi:hypothetical protein
MNGIETPSTGIHENPENSAVSGSIPLAGTTTAVLSRQFIAGFWQKVLINFHFLSPQIFYNPRLLEKTKCWSFKN